MPAPTRHRPGRISRIRLRPSPRDSSVPTVARRSAFHRPNGGRSALRQNYSKLVRRFHPDRNGGDRSHEKKLGEVLDAYQTLKGARAFA